MCTDNSIKNAASDHASEPHEHDHTHTHEHEHCGHHHMHTHADGTTHSHGHTHTHAAASSPEEADDIYARHEADEIREYEDDAWMNMLSDD